MLTSFIKIIAGIMFLLCVLLTIYFDKQYAMYSPHVVTPQSGNIYKTFVHHGALVYLTKEQVIRDKILFFIPALCFCIMAFMHWLEQNGRSNKKIAVESLPQNKIIILVIFGLILPIILLLYSINDEHNNYRSLLTFSIIPIAWTILIYFKYLKNKNKL